MFNFTDMRPSSALLLLFIALAIPISLRSEDRKFRHFTTIQGLSYNTVFDIEQNKEGFIWIATGEGLNRYDSYGFKIYYSDKSENSIHSNDVRALLVTSENRLYVGTTGGLCLFRPEFDDFIRISYRNESIGDVHDILQTTGGKILVASRTGVYCISEPDRIEEKLPLENDMFQIQEDSSGNFWSYKRQRLFCFDDKGNLLKTYYVRPEGFPESIPSAISSITIDSHNRLWIGTFRNGLVLFDPGKEEFMPVPLKPVANRHPMYFVRDITEDQNGKYWIGTEKGLFIYDHESGSIEHYMQSFDPSIFSINDNAIYKIFRSRENIMWLGTYFGGLNFSEPLLPGFKTIQPGIKKGDLQGKALSQMMMAPDEKLWIATEDAGIAIYDRSKNSFEHILNIQEPGNDLIRNNIHALTSDKDGKIWSGNFFGGINEIDPGNFRIKNFSHEVNDTGSLINNFVFALYCDPSGLLWIGTMDGIDILDKRTKRFSRFKPEIFRGKFIYDIFPDKDGNFWFLTNDNSGLYIYNKSEDSIENFRKDSIPGLNGSSFICHLIDSRGKLWFGSRGDGLVLFDPGIRKFQTYDMDDGLPNNVIYGILEDDQNNLWLSSNKGISKFNYITGEIRNFTVDHGLTGNQFNYKSYLRTDDGTMYFGAVNGLTYFHPDQIRTFESEPEIHFTNFRLFNKPVRPGERSVLKKDIDLTDQIILRHNQNVISFEFIALDFYSRGKNNFFYYLDGFESTWQSAGNQNATYTNLPPGNYSFRIKATNIYNYPNNLERSIIITVLPPIWLTFWAYLGYAILLMAAMLLIYRMMEIRNMEKMALNIEKIEKEKLQELHQHKMNFFTYISHEFKTPLTIILASLDSLSSGEKIPDQFSGRFTTLRRNVQRLQFLINQLMDFRKIETDHATTNLQYGNIVSFLRELFEAFTTLFKRKKLEYIFISQTENLYIRFDPDKIEKIVSNLLSNAFKYTPEHGEIIFRIGINREQDNPVLSLTISDTGSGMTEDQLSKIFNLFYKLDDNQNEYQGSGIGLTLTQSLVKFLNGTITYESKPGTGTTFVVNLPFSEGKEPPSSHNEIKLNRVIIENLLIQSPEEDRKVECGDCNCDFEIFFVEDDKEFLKFISGHFSEKYRVSAFHDGAEAIANIQKKVPDLIVTDLMMPHMDGMALCKVIKTSFEYCHVPVIMLTAKSDIESRIEGFESGADVYLPKPFLLAELELQIKNILTSKASLKKHFIQFGKLEITHPLRNRDQQFIERISSVIMENLETPELGVSMLTSKLGIGRTLLHNKLKQILDLSTTEFINSIRLREAQNIMIENPDLTISEISYRVGFSDPNYFSRTFRKNFNIAPSDFRNERNKAGEALKKQ